MARQSILLSFPHNYEIIQSVFLNGTESNKVINEFADCIRFINSLSKDTELVLNFLSSGMTEDNYALCPLICSSF